MVIPTTPPSLSHLSTRRIRRTSTAVPVATATTTTVGIGVLLCIYSLTAGWAIWGSTVAAKSFPTIKVHLAPVKTGRGHYRSQCGFLYTTDEDVTFVLRGGSSSSSSSSVGDSNDEDTKDADTDEKECDDNQEEKEKELNAANSTISDTIPEEDNAEAVQDVDSVEVKEEDITEEEKKEGDVSIEVLDMEKAAAKATELRLEGKQYHDDGDFSKAAEVFRIAADTILKSYQSSTSSVPSKNSNGAVVGGDESQDEEASESDEDQTDDDLDPLPEDYATCRLHQALCYLKSGEYELCVEACSDVLQGEDNDEGDGDGDDGTSKPNLLFGSSPTAASVSDGPFSFSPAVRARAHHRRAKAKVELGDVTGAVLDARTGAFLGYDKAVALYGKLMRESSSHDISSAINPLYPSSGDSDLLQSLLSKATPSSDGVDASSPFGGGMSPLSMLMGGNSGGNGAASMLSALTGAGSGNGEGGFAGSMIRNLSKRLDDENTQETICNFLQRTNKQQLGSLVAMTPIADSINDTQLERVVDFCHGVTPRGIRRTVKFTKVTAYIVKLFRRLFKLINKYKALLAVLLILQWTKSSAFRPIPLSPQARKAAKKATKQALNAALKNSR